MANHKSAAKRAKQSIKKTERNIALKSRIKTAIRSFRESVDAGNKDEAGTKLAYAAKILRMSVSKGVSHKNTVSRRISRLAASYNKLSA